VKVIRLVSNTSEGSKAQPTGDVPEALDELAHDGDDGLGLVLSACRRSATNSSVASGGFQLAVATAAPPPIANAANMSSLATSTATRTALSPSPSSSDSRFTWLTGTALRDGGGDVLPRSGRAYVDLCLRHLPLLSTAD